MVIIWGRRNELVRVAPASDAKCPICKQATKHSYWLAYTYFHIYYLFGRVVKQTYRLSCDRCKNGKAVSLDNLPVEVRIHQPIPFMRRNGLWTVLGVVLFGPIVLILPIALIRLAFEKQPKPVVAQAEVKPPEPKPVAPVAAPPVAPHKDPPVQIARQVPAAPAAKVTKPAASHDAPEAIQQVRPSEPSQPAAPNPANVPGPRTRPQRPPRPSPPPQTESAVLGGGRDPQVRDRAPPDGWLVGFEVGLGKFGKNDVVRAVRPIYRVGDEESFGQQIGNELDRVVVAKAKPGYAVGAISVKAGLTADGFSATFMRINGQQLDPADAYESDWLGGPGGAKPKRLGGDGRRVDGIIAKQSKKNQCSGLGLLFALADAPSGP